ncbi:hypothetical protein CDD82_4817 [Ophiocordyceps australis]|uniref:DNA-(apurinic or apyrimidinic site) lyase n=1 Tax=Ophiocordyceps australis TaxID=1399860 RepID=A0A2C5Z129_9HYPO|nr:hypothetical protein CDD82_4817 [Ophiocordyceps australis]
MAGALKRVSEWQTLSVSLSELCIDTTLRCGQSFRWRKINDEWTCALQGRIITLKQDALRLHYKVTWPEGHSAAPAQDATTQHDTEELLRRYFSLELDLGALYKQWSGADANFRKRAPGFAGVRILSQDAWEALICFICSSNNNISRISQMVHKLCTNYGILIGHIGDEALHDFPTPESLTGKNVESHLRDLGFGYRAKYIAETARIVALNKPSCWLESLRNPEHQGLRDWRRPDGPTATYKEAHEALLSLAGVGPKVADCVCLMGLGWGESVPVDTHVWQIAQRDYKLGKTKSKTFNKAMYDAVGDHFRSIWGKYAGWAHSVLFTADLREFSGRGTQVQVVKTETSLVKTDEEVEEKDEDVLKNTPKSRSITPKSRSRKRRASTKVEQVITHVKKEEEQGDSILQTERRSSKRLRMR